MMATGPAAVTVVTSNLTDADHGSGADTIVVSSIPTTNSTFMTGSEIITGNDNLTDDGSISFLNRIQFNDDPGSASGTTEPWLDVNGAVAANLPWAVTQEATRTGYSQGSTPPLLFFIVSQATAQSWIDDGLTGVDLLDVGPFVMAISSGVFDPKADIDQNGNLDLLDVTPFVELLAGG